MKEIEKNLDGKGMRIGIVQSRFNPVVCEGLLGACRAQLKQQGVKDEDITLATVPGALRCWGGALWTPEGAATHGP